MINIEYKKAFLDALKDPKDWFFTGNINDLGSVSGVCICGHPIRYEFEISNSRKIKYVGSECINHFKGINNDLYNDLVTANNKFQNDIKDAKKQAKIEKQKLALTALKEEYEFLKIRITNNLTAYKIFKIRLPFYTYTMAYRLIKDINDYQKIGTEINCYKKRIELCKKLLENVDFKILKYKKEIVSDIEFTSSARKIIAEKSLEIMKEFPDYFKYLKIWTPDKRFDSIVRIYYNNQNFISIDKSYNKTIELLLTNQLPETIKFKLMININENLESFINDKIAVNIDSEKFILLED